MKVFISWSGTVGGAIGKELREWLPAVIQALKPYYSPEDIAKGTRWNTEISKELESSAFGLIVTTKEALQSAWVMFEAGALSKNIDKSRVIPILFGLEGTDVTGPLVQFQAANFTKSDIFRTLEAMNATLGPASLPDGVLKTVFEMWWPKLDEPVKKLLAAKPPTAKGDIRTDRDILEELLSLTRAQKVESRLSFDGPVLTDLTFGLKDLYGRANEGGITAAEAAAIGKRLSRAINHLARRSNSESHREILEEIREERRLLEAEIKMDEDSNSGSSSA